MVQRARGMQDILPEDEILYKKILSTIEQGYAKYGFDPVSHPAIERLDTLEAKSGEGIKTEIFRMDDGELGLRFDLTVSLARMMAEHLELPLPFKRYCIEKVWRREEPQYGRKREFMQADADIIGSKNIECEAELIACAVDILDQLGVKNYTIYINNRKLLTGALKHCGVSEDRIEDAIRIIDKLDKKSREEVAKELENEGFNEGIKLIETFEQDLEYYEKIELCADAVSEIKRLFALLEDYKVKNHKFNPSLARGLGYYTGIIYEIKSNDERLGTIVAGGRYDELIEVYAGRKIPAVGISFGIDRLLILLKRKVPEKKTCTKIVLVNVKDRNMSACIEYVQELRKNGVHARIDLMNRNMRKQLEYAAAIGAEFVGIIGDKEQSERRITLKNMKNGEQKCIAIDEAISALKA